MDLLIFSMPLHAGAQCTCHLVFLVHMPFSIFGEGRAFHVRCGFFRHRAPATM